MSFYKIKDQVIKGKNKPLLASHFRVKLHDANEVIESKSLSQVFKAEDTNQEVGYLSGYMSTWGNTDSVGDIVRKGAYTKTLKERRPRVLWQHNAYEPIGTIKEAYEDDKGLFAVIALNLDTQKGLETYNLYKSGAMDSFSVGIQLEKYNIIKNTDGSSSYEILETKLWEVSAVTFPANEQAIVTSVKEKYEEAIAKNTSVIEEEIVKSESIDDLITALTEVKKAQDESLMDFFFEKSIPAKPEGMSDEEYQEQVDMYNEAIANGEIQEEKSIEQKLADLLAQL